MSGFKENYEKKLHVERFSLCPSFESALLQIETTNFCNHRCVFCPNHKATRARRMIDKELCLRILHEGATLGIKECCFHMNGEPLLCPDLEEYIQVSKSLFYSYVFITTNGSLCDKNRIQSLCKAGLDSVKFSINAGTRESYKAVHEKDDFRKVIQNLEDTIDYRDRSCRNLKIYVSYVVSTISEQEMELFYKRFHNRVDEILFYHVCSYAGQCVEEVRKYASKVQQTTLPLLSITHEQPCSALNNTIAVTSEGYLSVCCSEAFQYGIVEDLNKVSLSEAWHGKRMTDIRKRHLENHLEKTICYNCIHSTQAPVMPLNKELYALGAKKP